MRTKHFKKECPSCPKFSFTDDGNTLCDWGKGKKKLITQKAGKIKPCNLLKKE
jgi:hypothetical protein